MTPEPLKGKIIHANWTIPFDTFDYGDVKSAVLGLIKFHEDRIEELIKILETIKVGIKDNELSWGQKDWMFSEIDFHYDSLMAIEYWLEDVV